MQLNVLLGGWYHFDPSPDWNVFGYKGFSTPGFLQTGTWGTGNPAGPGFGSQQTGPRLPDGGYVADWTFQNLDSNALAGGFYQLSASYDGQPGWNWQSRETQTTPDASTVQAVSVFAARDSR